MPGVADAETFKGGAKKVMIDIFGPWKPMDEMQVGDLQLNKTKLPPALIARTCVLEINVELEKGCIPWDVLDRLRLTHKIDPTALSISSTHGGNLYRNHALMRRI